MLEQIAADFNASQTRYQVNASFKGAYPETMVAAIAAFRAGNSPHIVQMFEVGTATMMPYGRVPGTRLLELGDAALYRAKQGGRDRVAAADA